VRTLLVGAGQVGRAVAAGLDEPPTMVAVPWHDPAAARTAITEAVEWFLGRPDAAPWALCWSAGKGYVGAPAAELDVQLGYLRTALDAVAAAPARTLAAGRFALASSAGGIHAQDPGGTVTEASDPTPVSDYGRHMLRQEQAVAELASTTGVPCLLGRISNVFGPGQDLRKPQGFISHLCQAMLRRDGIVLTVPPDTIRDFVYSSDVGRRMAAWIDADERAEAGSATVKLLVSGRSTTLNEVINVARSVARVPVRVTISPTARPGEQPLRTRFRSTTLLDLDQRGPTTSLAEGVHRTWLHLLRRMAAAGRPR
jgi:UDP-glucose 4-epimerase